jgi:TetR/AcrR family transcriptional regulator, ethionamide resistance regulator
VATKAKRATRVEKRAEIRRQLLRAAEVLLESGARFSDLRVEQLVSEAGVSRATFWAYFETKGALLQALAEEVIGQLLSSADVWWHLARAPTEAEINDIISQVAALYHANRAVMAAVIEVASYDADVKQTLNDMIAATISGLEDHITRGQSLGFVDPWLHPARTAAWLVFMSERGLYQLVGPATPHKRRRYVTALAHAYWNGLYATAVTRAD